MLLWIEGLKLETETDTSSFWLFNKCPDSAQQRLFYAFLWCPLLGCSEYFLSK